MPVTVGWGETSGCATLWGCSMVHRGKNIVNGSKNLQFLPAMCALCVPCPRRARTLHKRPLTHTLEEEWCVVWCVVGVGGFWCRSISEWDLPTNM